MYMASSGVMPKCSLSGVYTRHLQWRSSTTFSASLSIEKSEEDGVGNVC